MTQRLVILFTVLFLSPSLLAEGRIGFSSGDTFTAYDYEGSFTLFCPSQSRRVVCQGYGLEPGEYDHLVFPGSLDADEVTLTRVNTRGETRSKDSKIKRGANRSKKSFNLWIRTLFQRPLLSMGDNTIRYSFEKNGNKVSEGSINVQVTDGGLKFCRHMTLSGRDSDCQSPSALCSSYFRRTTCQ